MQAELNWSGEWQMLATKRRREAGAQQSRSSVFDQHNSCFSKLNICSSPSLYLYSQAVTIPSVPAPDIRKPLQPAHRAADLCGVLLSCWKQSPQFLRRRILQGISMVVCSGWQSVESLGFDSQLSNTISDLIIELMCQRSWPSVREAVWRDGTQSVANLTTIVEDRGNWRSGLTLVLWHCWRTTTYSWQL